MKRQKTSLFFRVLLLMVLGSFSNIFMANATDPSPQDPLAAIGAAVTGSDIDGGDGAPTNCAEAFANIDSSLSTLNGESALGFCQCEETEDDDDIVTCRVLAEQVGRLKRDARSITRNLESGNCITRDDDGNPPNTTDGRVYQRLLDFGNGEAQNLSPDFSLVGACLEEGRRQTRDAQRITDAQNERVNCSRSPNCITANNLIRDTNNPHQGSEEYHPLDRVCGSLLSGNGNFSADGSFLNDSSLVNDGNIQCDETSCTWNLNGKELVLNPTASGNQLKNIGNNLASVLVRCGGLMSLNQEYEEEQQTPALSDPYAPGIVCRGRGAATKDYVACKRIQSRLKMVLFGKLAFQSYQNIDASVTSAQLQADNARASAQGDGVANSIDSLEGSYSAQARQASQGIFANAAEFGVLMNERRIFPNSSEFQCGSVSWMSDKRTSELMGAFLTKLGFPNTGAEDTSLKAQIARAMTSELPNFSGDSACEDFKTVHTVEVARAFMNQSAGNAVGAQAMMAAIQGGLNGLQWFMANDIAKQLANASKDLKEKEAEFQPSFQEDLLIDACAIDDTQPGCANDPNNSGPVGFQVGGNLLGGGGGSGGGIVQGAFNTVGGNSIDPGDVGSPASSLEATDELIPAGRFADLADGKSSSVAGAVAQGSGIASRAPTSAGGGGAGAGASGGSGGSQASQFQNNKAKKNTGLGNAVASAGKGGGGWYHKGGSGKAKGGNPLSKLYRGKASVSEKIINFNKFPSLRGGTSIFDRISTAHRGAVAKDKLQEYEIKQ